jgi:hypothetical protein
MRLLAFCAFALCMTALGCAPSLQDRSVAAVPMAFDIGSLASDARAAYEVLRTAHRFEGPYVGLSGATSEYALAFRVLVGSPNARAAFLTLFRDASRAGRLYAAAGIYFADPPSFDAAIAELAGSDGIVQTMDGCIVAEEHVAEIARSSRSHIEIPFGKTIGEVMVHIDGRSADLAGGLLPLRLLNDQNTTPGPRGPAK